MGAGKHGQNLIVFRDMLSTIDEGVQIIVVCTLTLVLVHTHGGAFVLLFPVTHHVEGTHVVHTPVKLGIVVCITTASVFVIQPWGTGLQIA